MRQLPLTDYNILYWPYYAIVFFGQRLGRGRRQGVLQKSTGVCTGPENVRHRAAILFHAQVWNRGRASWHPPNSNPSDQFPSNRDKETSLQFVPVILKNAQEYPHAQGEGYRRKQENGHSFGRTIKNKAAEKWHFQTLPQDTQRDEDWTEELYFKVVGPSAEYGRQWVCSIRRVRDQSARDVHNSLHLLPSTAVELRQLSGWVLSSDYRPAEKEIEIVWRPKQIPKIGSSAW